jgi:class 3 adenylate cyclase
MTMDENQKLDRTWLCSVVFMDIVKYSCQSQEVQIRWKQFFNEALSDALRDVAPEERVAMDTGDGAAICFLGDPEPALLSTLAVRESFVQAGTQDPCSPLVRLGINLGPVKLTRDINGNVNALGDGINVAQRIMSFSGINQIAVSRSYYDVISRISEDYGRAFGFAGIRLDKHVRQYFVYELLSPGSQAAAAPPETARPSPELLVGPRDGSPEHAPELDPEALKKVEECLAVTMGPIAGYLVASLVKQAPDFATLCDLLASRLASSAEQEDFRKRCRHSLGEDYRRESKASSQDPKPRPGSNHQAGPAFPAELLEKMQADLAHYIGPIARHVVKRAAEKSSTLPELLENISGHISSHDDRRKFLASKRL